MWGIFVLFLMYEVICCRFLPTFKNFQLEHVVLKITNNSNCCYSTKEDLCDRYNVTTTHLSAIRDVAFPPCGPSRGRRRPSCRPARHTSRQTQLNSPFVTNVSGLLLYAPSRRHSTLP